MDADEFRRRAETWAQRARDAADVSVRDGAEQLARSYAALARRLGAFTDTDEAPGALTRR